MLKKIIGGSVLALTFNSLYKNDWNLHSLGIIRLGRVALTTGSIVIDYKKILNKKNFNNDFKKWNETHTLAAKKLLNLCIKNGGVYIKVGQHIAALQYLVPKEYCEVLQILHSKVPKSSLDDVKSVIIEDFKKPLEELFIEFCDVPLGTASLAQVHKAVLKTGEKVAVKVQHKDVKNNSTIDIISMNFFVELAAKLFPEFSFKWLAEEMKINLPLELDFINEGKNCEKIKKLFKKFNWFKTPKIYWNFSSHRVLTMELMEGAEITQIDYIKKEKINLYLLTQRLSELYSEMIFVNGYVHCDPHPGNIIVRQSKNGPEIILLDHGLYTILPEKFKDNYCKLWYSIIYRDLKGIQKYGKKLNVGELHRLLACILTAKPWDTLSEGLIKNANKDNTDLKIYATKYVREIAKILSFVPRELLLILKTNDLIRGIEHQLGTKDQMSCFITMSKCCVHSIYNRKIKNSNSWFTFHLHLKKIFTLFMINMYQYYCYFKILI